MSGSISQFRHLRPENLSKFFAGSSNKRENSINLILIVATEYNILGSFWISLMDAFRRNKAKDVKKVQYLFTVGDGKQAAFPFLF